MEFSPELNVNAYSTPALSHKMHNGLYGLLVDTSHKYLHATNTTNTSFPAALLHLHLASIRPPYLSPSRELSLPCLPIFSRLRCRKFPRNSALQPSECAPSSYPRGARIPVGREPGRKLCAGSAASTRDSAREICRELSAIMLRNDEETLPSVSRWDVIWLSRPSVVKAFDLEGLKGVRCVQIRGFVQI